MRQPRAIVLVAASMVMLGLAAVAAFGQRAAPTETTGMSTVPLRSLDLSDEIDSVKGRPLRMRKLALEPGGALGLHSHKDRPTVSYVLQGELTYHEAGKPDFVVRPGDGFAEGKATTHWVENRGTVPAVWIAVDIPKTP